MAFGLRALRKFIDLTVPEREQEDNMSSFPDIMELADILKSSGRDRNGGGYDTGYEEGYMYALQQAGIDTGKLGDRFNAWRGGRLDERIGRLEDKRAKLDLPAVRPFAPQALAKNIAQTQLANAAETQAENEVFDDYRIFSIIKPQSLAAATQLVVSRTPPRLFQIKKILISTSQTATLRVDTFNVEGEPLFYGDSGFLSDTYGPLTTYRIELNYITQAVPIDVAITNLSAAAAIVGVQCEGFFTPKSKTRRALNQ